MTQAIELVQQTDMGRLVQQREELQEQLTEVKRQLRNYRGWRPQDEAQRKRNLEYYQNQIADSEAKNEQHRADIAELEPLCDTLESERLRVLIGQLVGKLRDNIASNQYHIDNYRQSMEQTQVDPRVRLSNQLADLEQALDTVRQQIKEARGK